MGNHGSVVGLQTSLNSTDKRVHLKAVRKLCNLCEDEQMQDRIVKEGGVQTLLRLCDSCRAPASASTPAGEDSIAVWVRATRALWYLSNRQDVAGMIADYGMGTLEGLCRVRNDDLLHWTSGILENLLRGCAHVRCLETGIMRPLSHLLQHRVDVAHKSLWMVCELSKHPQAKLQIMHLELIPQVMKAFYWPLPSVHSGVAILTQLAEHSAKCRTSIIQAGALEPLTGIMLDGSVNADLQYEAAYAICALAGGPAEKETRAKVTETVTFYPFLMLASSNDPRVLNIAVWGLSVVLESDRDWLRVIHIHNLQFLVSLLAADDMQWLVYVVQRILALASQKFACCQCGRTPTQCRWYCHICETNYCIECWSNVTQDPTAHDKTHEVARFDQDLRQNFVENGVLPRLVDMSANFLASPQMSAARTKFVVTALETLAVLARKEIAQISLMDTSILETIKRSLAGKLQGPEDNLSAIREHCTNVLASLSQCDLNTHPLMEDGMLTLVLPQALTLQLQRPAVRVISRLAPVLRHDGLPAITQDDGIGTLMMVAYTDDDEVRTDVVLCLSALAAQGIPDVGQALVNQGAFERLYYYLTADNLCRQLCQHVITSLRHLQPYDYAQVLCSEDWFTVLTDLLLREEPLIPRARPGSVAHPLIRQLEQMDEDLLWVVSTILHDISSQPARRSRVVSQHIVQVLDRCCYATTVATCHRAARCLMHISSGDASPDITAPVCDAMLKTLTRLAAESSKGTVSRTMTRIAATRVCHDDGVVSPNSGEEAALLRTVSACLSNIAAQQLLKVCFTQETVNAVIALAGTQDSVVQHNAVRCLKNLTLNGPLTIRPSAATQDERTRPPLTLKCYMGDSAVLLSVPRDISYEDLMQVLTDEYKAEVHVKYYDFNKDLVTVASQRSLETAKSQHEQRCQDLPPHARVFDLYLSQRTVSVPAVPTPLTPATPTSVTPTSSRSPTLAATVLAPRDNHLPSTGSFDFNSPLAKHKKIRWKRGNFLGRGAFATVYQGLNTDTGQLMAVKQIDMTRERSAEQTLSFEQEIEMLQRFSHPNIVQYLGAQRDGNHLDIFLQYIPGGSIAGLLQKYGRFPERVIKGYVRQILQGLSYLHSNGIVHRDIKGANILVMDDGVIKLADFGASRKLLELTGAGATQNKSILGTPGYMAPEVISKRVFSEKSDSWSVGATVYEMYCGSRPYSNISNPLAIMYHVVRTGAPTIPQHVSPHGRDFLNSCFQADPAQRPKADELLQHEFLEARLSRTSSIDSFTGGREERTQTASTASSEQDSDPSASVSTQELTATRTFKSNDSPFGDSVVPSVVACPYGACSAEPFANVHALHEHLSRVHLHDDPGPRPEEPTGELPVFDFAPSTSRGDSSLDISFGEWNPVSVSLATTPWPSTGNTPSTGATPRAGTPEPLPRATPEPLAPLSRGASEPVSRSSPFQLTPAGTPGGTPLSALSRESTPTSHHNTSQGTHLWQDDSSHHNPSSG